MGEKRSEDPEPSESQGGHAAERLRQFLHARQPVQDADPATPEEGADDVPPAHENGAEEAQPHRNDSLLAPPDTPDPSDTEAD
ncbi:hypothetical protein ACFY1L_04105 [Streptomyces sp. NPDC001663]|uniref:hypothetical protein n=1 Tax=Streptomyces sp. NPDC001663 TaxID=3364597 RepID=UPI0036887ED1